MHLVAIFQWYWLRGCLFIGIHWPRYFMGMDWSYLWGYILDRKHESKLPHIYRPGLPLRRAWEERLSIGCKLSCSHYKESGDQYHANHADKRAQIRLKIGLLLKCEIDSLPKEVHRFKAWTRFRMKIAETLFATVHFLYNDRYLFEKIIFI